MVVSKIAYISSRIAVLLEALVCKGSLSGNQGKLDRESRDVKLLYYPLEEWVRLENSIHGGSLYSLRQKKHPTSPHIAQKDFSLN